MAPERKWQQNQNCGINKMASKTKTMNYRMDEYDGIP